MCFPGYRGYGRRVRPSITAKLISVQGATTIISLPHACLAAGLLGNVEAKTNPDWEILKTKAHQRWGGEIDQFLTDAVAIGITPELADAQVRELRGAVIGWTATDPTSYTRVKLACRVCPDLALSIAILARRVANIFIAS